MAAEFPSALHRSLGIPADYATRGLAFHAEADPSDLVKVANAADDLREVLLAARAADAWQRMCAAAAADGIALLPLSGFRSIARQTEIIRTQLAAGRTIDDILRTVAAPGFSEHHTGRALDLGAPGEPRLEEGFADTAAFGWLSRRAGEFGFWLSYPRGNAHGIAFEPWHWCWHQLR
ncbi:MAG TPA: M15 family metallopeptidase [Opitutus sp.]|nr:M15 family metallopeptidase [Opitutus sp.]